MTVLLQVLSEVLQVELPLIQEQLQDLNQTLSQLQRKSWGCEGDVLHETFIKMLFVY